MKKILCLPVLILALAGCTAGSEEMEAALAFRSKLLGAQSVTFQAEISADYIDHVERFTLDCRTDSAGALTFEVAEPEEIAGITGTVVGETGTLTFDDTILAFPLMADDYLSPVSGPWIMMKALRSGYITSCAVEGELLRVTVDDSYADDALTLEVWLSRETIVASEISWQGRRQMTMEIEEFVFG